MNQRWINQRAARAAYWRHRVLWDRKAAMMITMAIHAADPMRRLSAALTCAAYGIGPAYTGPRP